MPINGTAMPEAEPTQSVDDADLDGQLSSEDGAVLRWRYSEIRRLGMNRVEARLLAESGADLSLLRRLVEAGCPAGTAVRIAL